MKKIILLILVMLSITSLGCKTSKNCVASTEKEIPLNGSWKMIWTSGFPMGTIILKHYTDTHFVVEIRNKDDLITKVLTGRYERKGNIITEYVDACSPDYSYPKGVGIIEIRMENDTLYSVGKLERYNINFSEKHIKLY